MNMLLFQMIDFNFRNNNMWYMFSFFCDSLDVIKIVKKGDKNKGVGYL